MLPLFYIFVYIFVRVRPHVRVSYIISITLTISSLSVLPFHYILPLLLCRFNLCVSVNEKDKVERTTKAN